jgi:hypothetical protein
MGTGMGMGAVLAGETPLENTEQQLTKHFDTTEQEETSCRNKKATHTSAGRVTKLGMQ